MIALNEEVHLIKRIIFGEEKNWEDLNRSSQSMILILYANSQAFSEKGIITHALKDDEIVRIFNIYRLNSLPQKDFDELANNIFSSKSKCKDFLFHKGIIDFGVGSETIH